MKILGALTVLFLLQVQVLGQSNTKEVFQNFLKDPMLENASVAFIAKDLSTGEVILEHNANVALPTASTAKLFSTSTALEILGPDYRAKTRLYTDGTISPDGTLNGNLWIRGGGDPSLGSTYFNDDSHRSDFLKAWCDTLKSKGIKKITGAIIADASEFGYMGAPDSWTWSDMGNYYGSGPSGLTIYDNRIELDFRTSNYIGGKSTIKSISPEVPGLLIRNEVTSAKSSSDNAYVYGSPFSLDRFVTGTLPAGRSSFIVKGSMPDPEYQFAHELNKTLVDQGIFTSGEIKTVRLMTATGEKPSYTNFTLIYTHSGEKLIDIINWTNMKSVNLFAEHLLCLVGYEKSGIGTTSNGIQALRKYWSDKIDISSLELRDGSGLSRTNGITPNNYADLLTAMSKSKYKSEFYQSLPVSGESGTLKSLNKGEAASGRVHAKSGTMNRIKSYAGYIETSSGKTIVFAIIANNYSCSATGIKNRMEPIFNSLSKL